MHKHNFVKYGISDSFIHFPALGLDETKMPLSLYMGEVGHDPSVHVGAVTEVTMATDTNSTVLTLDNLATRITHTHTHWAVYPVETAGMSNVLFCNACSENVTDKLKKMTQNLLSGL